MTAEPNYANCPSCPEIKKKTDRIDLALMGEDGTGMNSGIVKALLDLKTDLICFEGGVRADKKNAHSWLKFSKDICAPVLSSLLTAGIMYLILRG